MDKLPFSAYDFFGYVAPGLILLVGLEWTLGYPHLLHSDLKLFGMAAVTLAVYAGGQMIAGPAKTVLETWLACRWIGRPSNHLLGAEPPKWAKRVFPAFCEGLPAATQERVRTRARAGGVHDIGEPLFQFVRYHDGCLSNDRLMKKLDHFVAIYGFARNMSFAFLLVAVALMTKIALGYGAPKDATRAGLLLVGGVLLVYRFLKFYRQYAYEMFNHFGSFKEAA
jgi:hypothetical protein